MTEQTKTSPIKSVLFVCNQNSVRSPMAFGLAFHHCKRRIFVDSCGLITGLLDGFSVAALNELDIDIAQHEAKALNDIDLKSFDLVIALTAMSHERLADMVKDTDTQLEYWPTADPSHVEGTREQMLDAYRQVRDSLQRKIQDRLNFSG